MNKLEISGFNRGVTAVLSIAAAAAAAIRAEPGFRPTRSVFAIAVLDALAEEGRALLIGDEGEGGLVQPVAPTPIGTAGGEIAIGSKVKVVDYCGFVGPNMVGREHRPAIAVVKARLENAYAIELPGRFTGGSSLDGICAEGCGAWVPEDCLDVVGQ